MMNTISSLYLNESESAVHIHFQLNVTGSIKPSNGCRCISRFIISVLL